MRSKPNSLDPNKYNGIKVITVAARRQREGQTLIHL